MDGDLIIRWPLADGEASRALLDVLRDLEAQADADERQLAALERLAARPIELPTPAAVRARVLDIEARLRDNPTSGREALRELFKDGKIRLEIEADGNYQGRGEIFPLLLFRAETQNAEPSLKDSALYEVGSGGRPC